MNTITELLQKNEKCPEMYIGSRDIHRLRAFLSGYSAACRRTDPGFSDRLWQDLKGTAITALQTGLRSLPITSRTERPPMPFSVC